MQRGLAACPPARRSAALTLCCPARPPAHPPALRLQVYELKKDEIDGAINKLRTQATGIYDKHLHKVRRSWVVEFVL